MANAVSPATSSSTRFRPQTDEQTDEQTNKRISLLQLELYLLKLSAF